MAWRSKCREETPHLVIDLRHLLTAMEWERTKWQILHQFETTSLPNCLERQPNIKELDNKSVGTTVEAEMKKTNKQTNGDRN